VENFNKCFNIVGFYCSTTEVVPGVAKTEQKMQVGVKQCNAFMPSILPGAWLPKDVKVVRYGKANILCVAFHEMPCTACCSHNHTIYTNLSIRPICFHSPGLIGGE
jgi:hypothetical protein